MMISTKKDNLSFVLSNQVHEIVSDVNQALGGNNEGLNPHDLLEGALAACTSITVMMYARRKNINLTDVKVIVKIAKEGEENLIQRDIEFMGPVSLEEKQKLLEIANKCPIHKLLTHKTEIETRLL